MTQAPSGNRRSLALWFPYLSTDRLRRNGGAPPEEPLVVLAKVRSALRIVHSDAKALKLGLTPGLTLADARARVPDVAVADDDPAADAALLGRVADWCDRFTPLVGRDDPDGLLLDITGCTHLFGGETAMLHEVMHRLSRLGLTVRGAVAGAPDAVRAVARFGPGGIIALGMDVAAVRPLPVAALGLEAAMVLALTRSGLKTVADLADRPRAPLAARFGRDLVDRLARMLGEADHPISPQRPVLELLAEQRFAEPIAREDGINATLAGLARGLAARLERRGLGGRSFEASFYRADGVVRRIAVDSGRPLRDATTLARLFAARLDALADPVDPGFGFDLIRLAALATEPLHPAQNGFDGCARDDEAVAELIDRLSARFGATEVVRFVAEDSFIPERAYRAIPALATMPSAMEWDVPAPGEPPLRPLRLFDPPEPVEAMAQVPDGPPVRFRWRRLIHDIVAAEGPERIAAEWWRDGEAALTRDYFRVEDRHGHRFWLFREGLYEREAGQPRWFLHGLFA